MQLLLQGEGGRGWGSPNSALWGDHACWKVELAIVITFCCIAQLSTNIIIIMINLISLWLTLSFSSSDCPETLSSRLRPGTASRWPTRTQRSSQRPVSRLLGRFLRYDQPWWWPVTWNSKMKNNLKGDCSCALGDLHNRCRNQGGWQSDICTYVDQIAFRVPWIDYTQWLYANKWWVVHISNVTIWEPNVLSAGCGN